MKPLFPLKSKKVGIIRDSDLLMIARKIDEVKKRANGAENKSEEAALTDTSPTDDNPEEADNGVSHHFIGVAR